MNNTKKKLGKGIYRGIYTELAKEEGCTPQNIWNAIWVHTNPRMIKKALQKINDRKKLAEQFSNI